MQLHGVTKSVSLTLTFKKHKGNTMLYDQKTVTLNDENQYQAVVTLKASP